MSIAVKIPNVGESIQEVQIGRWLKREGDAVEADENVLELETDKASLELPAPAAGVLREILKQPGESVSIGETVAYLEEGGLPQKGKEDVKSAHANEKDASRREEEHSDDETDRGEVDAGAPTLPVTPSARRALLEFGLTAADVHAEGDRIRREDVLRTVDELKVQKETSQAKPKRETVKSEVPKPEVEPASATTKPADSSNAAPSRVSAGADGELEQVVPMTLIRRRIAERLVEAQRTAALLTTFNEIDMSTVMALRKEQGERFRDRYGVKLGFMSFFVKGAIDALKEYPQLNSEVRGTNIVYRNYFHIGVAIGSERGLVVPVLRNAERLSFAEIELAISDFATRAQVNKLSPEELSGGTFTISNGGVYGSLLSTPIVNPPQSGVLGMHSIQDRPVARGGQVVIRPMMYVALTYDHRVVDGREAVSFLARLKEAIEDPTRMLIEA
jgi:2-oxoglutarate dehydrogenase E2 component (dihydrolipoamide succinyltransferase)